MRLSREANLAINYLLNEWVPPAIRDARWFGWLLTRALYGKRAPLYMHFHDRVFEMTDVEFKEVYAQAQSVSIERDSDLNQACIQKILAAATGPDVLEVGCGRGFLSGLLAGKGLKVTACDVVVGESVRVAHPGVTFVESPAERLPFDDRAFDTVVTTHMLEHVRDLSRVLAELRRVCRGRLIVVVPKERPHFYTPNLHVHFFPYRYSLLLAFRPRAAHTLENAGGDWFYTEDLRA